MQASNATVWLAGDFNAPNIDWETMTLKNNHAHTQTHNSLLTRIAYDHGLTTNVSTSATSYSIGFCRQGHSTGP